MGEIPDGNLYIASCGCEIHIDDVKACCDFCKECCHCCKECGDAYCEVCYNCNKPVCIHECFCEECEENSVIEGVCENCGYNAAEVKHKKQQALEHIEELGLSPNQVKEKSMAIKFGLNPNLQVPQLAANYYLLHKLATIDRYYPAIKKLEEMGEKYAPEFATYFDLALGGELRYCNMERWLDDLPKPPPPTYRSSRGIAWFLWSEWLTPPLRTEIARRTFFLGSYKDEEGRWHSDGEVWNGSFGGPPWGLIADTLLTYLNGKISKIQFLDRVWNLQHNGGIALNKLYVMAGGSGMAYVLDAHGRDDYKLMLRYASSDVRDMWINISKDWQHTFSRNYNDYFGSISFAMASDTSKALEKAGQFAATATRREHEKGLNCKAFDRWASTIGRGD